MKKTNDKFIKKSLNLETKRLSLRIFTTQDITSEYIKALNSKEVIGLTESRYKSWKLDEVKKYVIENAYQKWESVLIGMFLKDTSKHIGNIRLHSFSKYNRRVEVGIMIWDKNEWGKNFGTEALDAIINYLFEELGLHKICAEYYSINNSSARMFRKLKFNTEGIFKDHFLVNGKYADAVRIAKFKK